MHSLEGKITTNTSLASSLQGASGTGGALNTTAQTSGSVSKEGSLTSDVQGTEKTSGEISSSSSLRGATHIPQSGITSIPIASKETLGCVIVGENLSITEDGTLSVPTANDVSEDNTLPITAAAVFTEIGNIDILLKSL